MERPNSLRRGHDIRRDADAAPIIAGMPREHRDARHPLALRFIAGFKLFKGTLLFAVGIGALRLVHKDVAAIVGRWVSELRMDPQNRLIHALLLRAGAVDDHMLREIGVGTFFYAALLLTEGVGLWLEKRWAEYLTVILTGSFLPLEVYELTRRLNVTRSVILVINVLIVVYLIRFIRSSRDERGEGRLSGPVGARG
jgi:uncharacterized membrane protein (DUF2068 family)